MARPQKQVDPELVRKMARIGCTMEEISSVVDVSVDTLERRFADVIKKGREAGKTGLRRLQWKSARTGNVTMQIWLGKQLLGQVDKQAVDHTTLGQAVFTLDLGTPVNGKDGSASK